MPEPRVVRRFVPPEAFVRSYDPPVDMDPWTFVHRYRQARALREEEPSRPVAEIADRVDLPDGQLARWLGADRPPRLIRELLIARSRGWIDIDQVAETFRGLNVLVGSTFGLGTIDPLSLEPRFGVRTTRDIDRTAWAIDRVGLRYAMVRDSEDERARELGPTRHGAILGRVLVVLGAPVGGDPGGIGRLPSYLSAVTNEHRLAFARTVIESYAPGETAPDDVRIPGDRPDAFLDELAEFLADVAGMPVSREGDAVVVSADAAQSLGSVP